MLDELIGGRHQAQRLAAVPQLSARLLAAAPPLAAGALAAQRVTRGRLTAIVAVFGQARLQLLILGDQLLVAGNQLLNLRPLRVVGGPQRSHPGFQFRDALSWLHASTLHLQRKSGYTDPDEVTRP
jgi:hypothetical protein